MKGISIITINFNNAAGLERTLTSVRNQSLKASDFVIIDGGSTDNSLSVVEKNCDIISYYCSEKDKGIYDAQNKGIERSKGEYLLFLNSGDLLAEKNFLEKAMVFLDQKANHSFIYCNTILENAGGKFFNIVQPDQLDMFFFYRQTLNHQSCLIKRSLFTTYGFYDLQYKVCADFDFILKVFTADPLQFFHFNNYAAIYDNSGYSADPSNYESVVRERKQIINRYFSKQQLENCVSRERKLLGWPATMKRLVYNNKISYMFIRLYVKIKDIF